MAKTLSPKSQLIREMLAAHPDKGNTELANLINDSADRLDDKIEVTATEVSNQKTKLKAMKGTASKAAPAVVAEIMMPAVAEAEVAPEPTSNGTKKKPGRPKGSKKPAAPVASAARTVEPAPKKNSTVEVVDGLFDMAKAVGGFDQLKHIVDRLAAR